MSDPVSTETRIGRAISLMAVGTGLAVAVNWAVRDRLTKLGGKQGNDEDILAAYRINQIRKDCGRKIKDIADEDDKKREGALCLREKLSKGIQSRTKVAAKWAGPLGLGTGVVLAGLYASWDYALFNGQSWYSGSVALVPAVLYGLVMYGVQTTLATVGKPMTNYEIALYSGITGLMAAGMDSFFHEFYPAREKLEVRAGAGAAAGAVAASGAAGSVHKQKPCPSRQVWCDGVCCLPHNCILGFGCTSGKK